MWKFGGDVNNTSTEIKNDESVPDLYVYCNFNDLASAFLTLFELMVINNWQVIVEMYISISGSMNTLFFFISLYYLSVVIGLNIVIAFAIDMYNSIERLDAQYEEHQKHLYEMA